jgi:hypothetical protein
MVFLLIDEGNYRTIRFLEGGELLSAVHSPNHLIFCLQVPEGGDSVLLDYRRDAADGAVTCFPRFLRLPRTATPAIRDELVMETLRRGVEDRRGYSASELFSCSAVTAAEGRPWGRMVVVCKRETKLLTFMEPEKAGMGWSFEDK